MDWVLGSVVNKSHCRASINTEITDFVIGDDAIVFAESLGVLIIALEALHKESKT